MPTEWWQESCDLHTDPVSGARVVQLTSAAMISNNIYGEQPYTSPDGKRVIIARCHDFCFDEVGSLLVHELDTLRITMVERESVGPRGVFNAAWSGLCYYWTPQRELVRISLMTLEKDVVYVEKDPDVALASNSVSPDQRYVIGQDKRLDGPGAPVFQIVRLDLETGTRDVILEHPEIVNPHLQFNPVHGRQILVQNDRGIRMAADGATEHRATEEGTTLFVIDADGSNLQYVPVGQPITASCTGHECFIGDTGQVLFSAHWVAASADDWSHDSRHKAGNIMTACPGDEQPTVFEAPEHFFNHVCASRCGKYFVADSFEGGGNFGADHRLRAASLVIGNLETRKYRTAVADSMAPGGGNQCTHTHPYLTADNRFIVYNAAPGGAIPQVFAAELTDDFLPSLD